MEIKITDITEGNRAAKFAELEKCLRGGKPDFIPADDTRKLPSVNIKIKDYSKERIEKALRTMAMSFGVPSKSAKGELFLYKAQEDLTDKWCAFFSKAMRDTYDFVTDYFGLPEKTVMSKSENLTHKGKVLYNPDTGEPIKKSDWEKFVKSLEKFLNRNIQDCEKRIILESKSLSRILDRMLKYNTFEAVKTMRLEGLQYHGKSFDWISDNVKNMKNVFGDPLNRDEQARIEILQQSAAVKVTNITNKVKGDIQQILIDGIKAHKSKSQVSQDLFDKMVGDNRDYQRLADSEIQNAFNGATVREEVQNTPEGEKTYFERIEAIDGNTCPFCKQMNGKIAVWSEKPQRDEKAHDGMADYVIWEGKEWTGNGHIVAMGIFHPYCRGTWARYDPDGKNFDALIAERSGEAKRWNAAVSKAKSEFKEKGIENPDDTTKGYADRIKEIFNGGTMEKSLSGWEEQPRAGNGQFGSKGKSPAASISTAGDKPLGVTSAQSLHHDNISFLDNSQEFSDVKSKLSDFEEELGQSTFTPEIYLAKVKACFNADDLSASAYGIKTFGDEVGKLRISDHSAVIRNKQGKKTKNTSIVIQLNKQRGRRNKARVIEYIYEPESFTSEKQKDLLEGIKGWIENGIFCGEKYTISKSLKLEPHSTILQTRKSTSAVLLDGSSRQEVTTSFLNTIPQNAANVKEK